MSARAIRLVPALAILQLLCGCAMAGRAALAAPAPPQSAPPPVAATFRTHLQHTGRREVSEWRYWRSADRVQREDLRSQTGELWQRDGATLFHTLLFHADRRGVEFEQADLRINGADAAWEQHTQIVSPTLLQRLTRAGSGRTRNVPYEDYSGVVDAVRWRVRMRTDLMVPLRVEQRRAGETLRIELIEAHPLSQAPWAPPATEGYGMLDFADLGDHERDPFVQRIQAHLGLNHGPGHAH